MIKRIKELWSRWTWYDKGALYFSMFMLLAIALGDKTGFWGNAILAIMHVMGGKLSKQIASLRVNINLTIDNHSENQDFDVTGTALIEGGKIH